MSTEEAKYCDQCLEDFTEDATEEEIEDRLCDACHTSNSIARADGSYWVDECHT